nr:hypothetical protein [Tanacetum cinerariifolium]
MLYGTIRKKVTTNEELSNSEDRNLNEEEVIAQIFKIDTNIFHFETPLCKEFEEFNYLLGIDADVLTKYIPEFKTYGDYKDDWIYEWNDKIPWVHEKPWMDDKPTCNQRYEGYCNEGNLHESFQVGNTLQYQDYEWYEALEVSDLKDETLRKIVALEESMNQEEESNEIEQNKYGDDDTGYLYDYLVYGNAPFITNEEEERSKEIRCKLLWIPFTKPPACKMESFAVVKYSFRPSEKYVTIKECGYYDWMKTEENACHAYQDIFYKIDEGWFVTRAK